MRRTFLLLLLGAPFAAVLRARALTADSAVSIDNFTFSPASITVPAGTKVLWTNNDDIPHTVTSEDRVLRSPPLDTGDAFSFVFGRPGRYPYFCSLHAHMQGVVIVE